MKETLRHRQAFEAYYAMGEARSLESLAAICKVSAKSAKKWSKELDWQKRIAERDAEIADALAKKAKASTLATKLEYRKLVQATLSPWVQRVKAGQAGVESVRDMDCAIKLDLLLMGEPTEHIKGQVSADDLFDRIAKYADVFDRLDKQGDTNGDGAGEPLDTE